MNSRSVDLTVIIPTFRREKEVQTAAREILKETQVPLEVFVVDDSPEGSAREAILAIADPRLRYLKRDIPSRGKPAIVRNEAAKQARGRFLYFLDDDDRPEPATLVKMMRRMDELSAGVGMAAVRVFTETGNQQTLAGEIESFSRARKILAGTRSRYALIARLLFQATLTTCGACMIRRDCFERVGGFNSTMPLYEDVEMYMRAIRRFGFAYVDEVVLNRRTGQPSLINDEDPRSGDTARSYQMMYQAYESEHGAAELLALKVLARVVLAP